MQKNILTWLVIGGLVGLGVYAYYSQQVKPKAPEKLKKAAPGVDRNDPSSSGSWSSRRSRKNTARKSSKRILKKKKAAERQAFGAVKKASVTDAGVPDQVETPERPPKESSPEKPQKPYWIRGRVISLPSKKALTSFTVVYAKSKGNFWASGTKKLGSRNQFPEGAKKKELKLNHSQGHFQIKVPKGSYILQVRSKGYQDGTPAPARATSSGWFRQTFALVKAGRSKIKGRVLGRKDKPLAGAFVVALLSGGSRWGWRMLSFARMSPSSGRLAFTKADGTFEIDRLPAGKYGISIQALGHISWKQRGIEIGEDDHKDIGTIKLSNDTGTIKGKVYGPDGQPKAKVSVFAQIQGKKGRSFKFNRTDEKGEYTLLDVPIGKITLYASIGRGFMASRKMTRFDLKTGETKVHDFRFGEGGVSLIGEVRGPDKSRLAGVQVSAFARIKGPPAGISSGMATTNAKGEYKIVGLQKGLHTITLKIKGKPSPGGVADIKGPGARHDIFVKGGALELQFIDEKTKRAPKVPIWAILTSTDTKNQRLVQRSNKGQNVVFNNLPEKDFQLRLYSPGYSTLIKKNLTPGANGKKNVYKLTMKPAGILNLKLQTPDNKPPNRAYVMLSIDGKYKWVPSYPNPGGEQIVRALPPGSVNLKVIAEGYEPLVFTINIPTKGAAKATYTLTPKKVAPKPTEDNRLRR